MLQYSACRFLLNRVCCAAGAKPDRDEVTKMCDWLFDVRGLGHTASMYEPGRYHRDVPPDNRTHGLVYRQYERLMRELCLTDFDDVLFKVLQLLACCTPCRGAQTDLCRLWRCCATSPRRCTGCARWRATSWWTSRAAAAGLLLPEACTADVGSVQNARFKPPTGKPAPCCLPLCCPAAAACQHARTWMRTNAGLRVLSLAAVHCRRSSWTCFTLQGRMPGSQLSVTTRSPSVRARHLLACASLVQALN